VPAKLKVVRGFERWLEVQTLRMCPSVPQIREVNYYNEACEESLEPCSPLGQGTHLRAIYTMMMIS